MAETVEWRQSPLHTQILSQQKLIPNLKHIFFCHKTAGLTLQSFHFPGINSAFWDVSEQLSTARKIKNNSTATLNSLTQWRSIKCSLPASYHLRCQTSNFNWYSSIFSAINVVSFFWRYWGWSWDTMHVSGSSSEPQSQPRRAFSTIKTHSHAGTDPVIKHTSALTLFHISRDLAHLAHSVLSVPSIWASLFSLADKHHPVLRIPVLHRYGSPQLRADSLHTHFLSSSVGSLLIPRIRESGNVFHQEH